VHLADRAHGHAHAGGFQHQAGDAHQRALASSGCGGARLQVGQVALPAGGALGQRSGWLALDASWRLTARVRPSCGRAPGPAGAAQRGRGLRPARGDARVDGADVAVDDGTPPRASVGSATSARRAPASASAAPSATSGRSCGCTCTVMWRALSSTALTASAATLATSSGCGQFAAQHLARQLHGGAGHGPAAIWRPAPELASKASSSAPICAVACCGEALLEALQRHQAVAVAVLVAGLAGGGDARCHSARGLGRAAGGAGLVGCGAGHRACAVPHRPPPKAPGVQLAKSPSSSRGMKRV
jgi:hypothetical protein